MTPTDTEARPYSVWTRRGRSWHLIEKAHAYLSTACLHGLHDRCRQACKFCGQPCLCECHQ